MKHSPTLALCSPRLLKTLGGIAFIVFLAACGLLDKRSPALAPEAARAPAEVTDSPLKRVQAEFRPTYEAARTRIAQSISPLIVSRFSDLYLFRTGQPTLEGKGIPPKYLRLHRTAHVPFVVFIKLEPYFGRPIPNDLQTSLADYNSRLDAAVPDLINYDFTPEEQSWQRIVIGETVEYLKVTLAQKQSDQKSFDEYERRVHRAVMSLACSAGAAQVDATHKQVSEWKALLTNEEWKRLRVLIIGPRQPRHNNAATQYFSAVFPGDSNSLFPGESTRVYYMESLSFDRKDKTFETERGVLAAMILDREASTAFFNNPYRMSIDVMADGARDRIEELDLSPLH